MGRQVVAPASLGPASKFLRSLTPFDGAALALAFESLKPEQLQVAYDYYEAFPAEIDAWLAEAATSTPDYLRTNFP
jgi:hypothetical protein